MVIRIDRLDRPTAAEKHWTLMRDLVRAADYAMLRSYIAIE